MTTWIIVPYFCKANLMINYLKYLRELILPLNFKIVIVNDRYPNRYPIDEFNSLMVEDLASFFHFGWVDCGKNLGMKGAINFALKEINAQPEDVIILSDPDDYPSPGAYEALQNLIVVNKHIAVAALT